MQTPSRTSTNLPFDAGALTLKQMCACTPFHTQARMRHLMQVVEVSMQVVSMEVVMQVVQVSI